MWRSHSEPGLVICPPGLTSGFTQQHKSSPSLSEYARLQGEAGVRSARASPAHEMRGGVLLKAAPDADKAMRVDFEASPSTLKIILKQERDGVTRDFVLFSLNLATLFVGWDLKHQDLFVLCAKHQDMVFHPIYCYPCRLDRNRWVSFFEDNGCEVARIKRLHTLERLARNRVSSVPSALSARARLLE
jgi:hypothetical protein